MTDNLKPVRCGCGGEAIYGKWVRKVGVIAYAVGCKNCGIQTKPYPTEAEAITAWNKAMGAGKSEIAITKGYWIVTYDGLYCSVCNYKCETTALPEVCPHCGASMK